MKNDLLMKIIEIALGSNNNKVNIDYPFGKHVIVRCSDAGVHYGVLDQVEGRDVKLSKSRRMYRWWAKKQMTLSAVAEFGLNEEKDLKIQNELESIILFDACEIIPCSKESIASFERVEPYDEQ